MLQGPDDRKQFLVMDTVIEFGSLEGFGVERDWVPFVGSLIRPLRQDARHYSVRSIRFYPSVAIVIEVYEDGRV